VGRLKVFWRLKRELCSPITSVFTFPFEIVLHAFSYHFISIFILFALLLFLRGGRVGIVFPFFISPLLEGFAV